MSDSANERRDILEAVARGELSPAEAAERLAALDAEEQATAAAEEPPEQPAPPPSSTLKRVRINAAGHPVRVFADRSVREATAEGPHSAHREGDTLVFTAELEQTAGFFFASVSPGARRDRTWRWAPPLTVRMHPDLALIADVTAGSLTVRDVRGPLTLSVSAGSVNLEGFAAPFDLDVSAGSLSASGVLNSGESRIRCNAGSVRLHLERQSSVRIRGMASAGRLVLPHPAEAVGAGRKMGWWFDQPQEAVVGDGKAVLDVEVTTGSVVVRADG